MHSLGMNNLVVRYRGGDRPPSSQKGMPRSRLGGVQEVDWSHYNQLLLVGVPRTCILNLAFEGKGSYLRSTTCREKSHTSLT